jgi:HlyD family secretion protein
MTVRPGPHWLDLREIGITPLAIGTVLLLTLAGQIGYFGFLMIMKAIMDAMQAAHNAATWGAMVTIFVTITVLSELYLFHRSRILRVGAQRLSARLQAVLLQSSVRNAVRVDHSIGVGILRDIVSVQNFIAGSTLIGALDLISAFLALALLFYIDSGFGWITVAGILTTIVLAVLAKQATARLNERAEQAVGVASSELGRDFAHTDTLRGLGQLGAAVFRWHRRHDAALDASEAVHARQQAFEQLEHFISSLFVLALLVYGVVLVFDGTGTMGLMLCATLGGYKAMGPFSSILIYWDSWRGGLGAWRRLNRMMLEDHAPSVAAPELAAPAGLVAKGLGFWPEGRKAPIIQDIDLTLPPGSVTLVQGRNGAGKSTFLRLVLGLLEPSSGRVLLHGHDTYFCEREALGSRIGYLPQDIQLLDANVRTNIGRGPDAPLEAVVAAARAAGVHEIVGHLPNGYATRCNLLSTGQQRMDEPEEALDGSARRMLLAGVERVRLAGGIVFVVTHEPDSWAESANYTLRLSPGGGWTLTELEAPEPVAVVTPGLALPGPCEGIPAPHGMAWISIADGPSMSKVMRTALVTLLLTLVPLIGWATMTRMERAVLAPGQLVPEGRRKTVNVLEPGFLRQIMVQEGSVVQAGQPLLQLDVTQAETDAIQARATYWSGRARAARLVAEQAGERRLAFPPEVAAEGKADPAIAVLLQAEQALFAARWASFDGQVAVQERAITQLRQQIAGARAQREGAAQQVQAVREQMTGYERLLAQGYASRFLVLNLQQQEAGLVGGIAQAEAREAQLREGILQAERQLEGIRLQRLSSIANDAQTTEAAVAAAQQQLRAAQDVLVRREVLAPEAGRVTNVQAFTPGSTIQPGQPILDLVPLQDRLVVEIRVAPLDIDQVEIGQTARVRLTALRLQSQPMLPGEVVSVAPDVLISPGHSPHYPVRVALDRAAIDPAIQRFLVAGTPVEAMLLGESRMPLQYFWEPVRGSARRPPVQPPVQPDEGS